MPEGLAPISADEIQSRIVAALPDAQVHIRDYTGGGDHYEAVVVSATFDGKNAVARHRLVYGALQEAMAERIHALALKTMTPQEFEADARQSGLVNIETHKS